MASIYGPQARAMAPVLGSEGDGERLACEANGSRKPGGENEKAPWFLREM